MINILRTCLVITLFSASAKAANIQEALEKAYNNNPKIKSLQHEYMSQLQEFPRILSEQFLPDVTAKSSISNIKQRQAPGSPSAQGSNYVRSLAVTQNLFAGGTSFAALSNIKHKLDVAKLTYIAKEQNFFLEGILTYIELIAAKERLEAANSLVASATKEYESVEEKLKVGEATKTDVAFSKAQLADAFVGQVKANAALLTKTSAYKSYFGEDNNDLSFPHMPTDLPETYEEFSEKAKIINLSTRIYSLTQKASKSAVTASAGSLLPSVNATAEASESLQDSAISTTNKSKQRSYTTTLSVTIPIFSHGGSEYSKVRQSKLNYRKSVYDLDFAKQAMETQLITDWQEFVAAKETVAFAEQALEARKLAYEGTKSMYGVGLTAIIDVLKAEKDLFDATVGVIQAKEQFIKAAYTIKSDLVTLSPRNLGLKGKIFDPESEFRQARFKIIGF